MFSLVAMSLAKGFFKKFGGVSVRSLSNEKNNGSNWSDVAIIGGGIMGSSVAYFLKDHCPMNLKVNVFERDFNYSTASTPLSVGGIRQQFSLPENIQMSMYTAEFLRNSKRFLSVDEPVEITLHRSGYLTIAGEKQAEKLMKNYMIQREHGASVKLLTQNEIKKKFPLINTDGIELAVYGTENEGWFDPYRLLMAMKNKAKFLGANYVNGTVIGFQRNDHSKKCHGITVKMNDGTIRDYGFDIGVICAGYNSGPLAQSLGYGSNSNDIRSEINFPIEPRKRYVYVVHCRNVNPDGGGGEFPFLIDNTGVYCRQEGTTGTFLCGRSPPSEKDEPSVADLDVDYSFFETNIHPHLANRVPCLEAVKIKSAWAGYYDYNRLDQNPIIGQDLFYSNIYWATGFSGHGIQMGPAIGKAMMEYITKGHSETFNLERFGWKRILENKPLLELNIY